MSKLRCSVILGLVTFGALGSAARALVVPTFTGGTGSVGMGTPSWQRQTSGR